MNSVENKGSSRVQSNRETVGGGSVQEYSSPSKIKQPPKSRRKKRSATEREKAEICFNLLNRPLSSKINQQVIF